MDFDLDADQRALLDQVDAVVAAKASGGTYDAQLDDALRDAIDPAQSLDLLGRVLITERLAELGTATTFGTALLVGAEVPPGGLAVATAAPRGLARYGGQAATLAFVSDVDVVLAPTGSCRVEEIRSGFGYPYARIEAPESDGTALPGAAASWRAALTLARSAEVAGNAASAVARTAEHLRERVQFGRPLATFQALRHRLADAAVSAEATRWLVREAAYTGSPGDLAIAASYAHQTAAALGPELVQMGGARSFAREFGLHVYTMRLEALRLELGAPDRLAAAINFPSEYS